MVLHLFCNQVTAVRFCHGAPIWNGPIMVLERIANPSLGESRVLGSSPSRSANLFMVKTQL